MTAQIYCYKILFDYLINIFCRHGRPLPGNFVTGNKKFSDKFIFHSNEGNIHSKGALNVFKVDKFFPLTFFEGERTPLNTNNKLYFCKKYTGDNAQNVEILSDEIMPPLVPPNHLIQEEVNPKLYKNKKFDLRVLTCFGRNGKIMIYKNIFFRINPNPYIEQNTDHSNNSHQFTAPIATKSNISFFQKTRPGEFDSKRYLDQLKSIIPQIYKKLIPIANRGFPRDIKSSFLIGGLDFIPSANSDQLMFLEYNATPGYNPAFGIENWQEFYQLATNFILDLEQNNEECIYI